MSSWDEWVIIFSVLSSIYRERPTTYDREDGEREKGEGEEEKRGEREEREGRKEENREMERTETCEGFQTTVAVRVEGKSLL